VEQTERRGLKGLALVIDDDPDIRDFISDALDLAGFECIVSSSLDECMVNYTPTARIIFIDLVLGSDDGVEVLRYLANQECKAGIALISGYDSRVLNTTEELASAMNLNVLGVLEKPIRLAQLDTIIQKAEFPTATRRKESEGDVIHEDEMRRAVARDEFVLHYQPKIEMGTDRVVGVEALVRWDYPQRGLIYPDAFIPSLERLGLSDQLTWLTMNRGLVEYHHFNGVTDKALTLSINVSAYSLTDLGLPDKITALAAKHGVSPSLLILEVTESGLIREFTKALDILARLRLKSIRLSIDDFGSGYSMLQQLRRVPANEIKIDKSFVQTMDQNDSAVIVRKTIELGHELNMSVVAEGVETGDQLSRLKSFDCDIAQGYLFSKPLPASAIVDWCRQGYA